MILVGSRPITRATSLVCAGAVVGATRAHAAAATPLLVDVTVTHEGDETVSDVQRRLGEGAGPGDLVSPVLPDHAGGPVGADGTGSNGVPVGVIRFSESGEVVAESSSAGSDLGAHAPRRRLAETGGGDGRVPVALAASLPVLGSGAALHARCGRGLA